jgi:hypothetical protein
VHAITPIAHEHHNRTALLDNTPTLFTVSIVARDSPSRFLLLELGWIAAVLRSARAR